MDTVTIQAPASKSLSHRALLAAGLASGTSRLEGLLESDDTILTRNLMSSLGAVYTHAGNDGYIVEGLGKKPPQGGGKEEAFSVFVGESGTTCRLMTAITAAGCGYFRVYGSGRMHERPIGELAEALLSLGVSFEFEGKGNCPPFIMATQGFKSLPGRNNGAAKNIEVTIGCDESSQYLSGLLLAAPIRDGLTVYLGGEKAVSWPYVSLTLDIMERFGVRFTVQVLGESGWADAGWQSMKHGEPGKVRFIVHGGGYRAREYRVEGDWSGASYFLAAGAIGPKAVRVSGLNLDSYQGDIAIIDILRQMGAKIETTGGEITVSPSPLQGIEVDMAHCPDLVPTVAALAAHACGETKISNVAHLVIKESDRIAAPAAELAKAGCRTHPLEDGLVISPPQSGLRAPDGNIVFSAHNDHRMAMSLSLLGLPGRKGEGFEVRLDNRGCVAKSFPSFWQLWEKVVG